MGTRWVYCEGAEWERKREGEEEIEREKERAKGVRDTSERNDKKYPQKVKHDKIKVCMEGNIMQGRIQQKGREKEK